MFLPNRSGDAKLTRIDEQIQIKVSAIVPASGEARTSEEQHVPCT
jgi:hypothetical protein